MGDVVQEAAGPALEEKPIHVFGPQGPSKPGGSFHKLEVQLGSFLEQAEGGDEAADPAPNNENV